jgi:hypothetical protein
MRETSGASNTRVLRATAIALAVAVVVLFAAILPAEYGIDPLGTGRALGLTALSGTESVPAPAPAAVPSAQSAEQRSFHQDEYKIELRPFEGVEYKYRLEQGASLVYSWESTAAVGFEFHGEPDGAPAKYFDSYSKGSATGAHGGFTAAKPGIHGWFWENKSADRVTVTLRSAGFYSKAIEFHDGDRTERKFAPQSR